MRAFIAIDLPKEIKLEISKIQSDLKKAGLLAKWVKPENIHLTLAFLGSIDKKQIKEIKEILTPINRFIEKPMRLQLGQVSAFPHPNKARVIFVNLSGEIEKLKILVAQIGSGLKNKKIWFDEKPFVAHLTLGRFKKPQNLISVIGKIAVKKILFEVKEISLYQSQLLSSGSIYTRL
jgi:2'-5' RNA ligase